MCFNTPSPTEPIVEANSERCLQCKNVSFAKRSINSSMLVYDVEDKVTRRLRMYDIAMWVSIMIMRPTKGVLIGLRVAVSNWWTKVLFAT